MSYTTPNGMGGGWGWGESPKSKGRPTPTYGGVDFLRFRDGKNLGHAFVGIYYKHSPKISIARIGESRGGGVPRIEILLHKNTVVKKVYI